jgi:D-glycero-D-manno-heptose 1,7-bisphosphate phosphatase
VATGSPLRPAVFLDRDGTLIEDTGFVSRPEQVRLIPGAIPALAALQRAGFALVTVSNQSGIARGLFSVEDYEAVAGHLDTLLAAGGVRLDAREYCPHHPDFTGPCACRKPGTELYEAAARRLGLDLPRSWWIGDRLTDLEPARQLGGAGLLVLTGAGSEFEAAARANGFEVVADISRAADRIRTARGAPTAPRRGPE